MEKSNIMICLEKKEEQQKVENLVRESFWNVYRPGCLEHYVLHQLKADQDYHDAYERILNALIKCNDESAAVILDEYRTH